MALSIEISKEKTHILQTSGHWAQSIDHCLSVASKTGFFPLEHKDFPLRKSSGTFIIGHLFILQKGLENSSGKRN